MIISLCIFSYEIIYFVFCLTSWTWKSGNQLNTNKYVYNTALPETERKKKSLSKLACSRLLVNGDDRQKTRAEDERDWRQAWPLVPDLLSPPETETKGKCSDRGKRASSATRVGSLAQELKMIQNVLKKCLEKQKELDWMSKQIYQKRNTNDNSLENLAQIVHHEPGLNSFPL